MTGQSFEDWLRDQRRREDAIGDLARYVADDPHWPTGSHAERRLDYLVGSNASTERIAAMAAANVEYGDQSRPAST